MNIRENMEQRERELLSPYASHSADTRGRDRPEEECDVRTAYQQACFSAGQGQDPSLQGFSPHER